MGTPIAAMAEVCTKERRLKRFIGGYSSKANGIGIGANEMRSILILGG